MERTADPPQAAERRSPTPAAARKREAIRYLKAAMHADEAEAEIQRVTEHPVPDPVQAGVQGVVDRQADRTGQLAELLEVAVDGDPPAVQPGADPRPGQLAVGVGPGDRAAQLRASSPRPAQTPASITPSSSGTMSMSSSTDTAKAMRRSSTESGACTSRRYPSRPRPPLTHMGDAGPSPGGARPRPAAGTARR